MSDDKGNTRDRQQTPRRPTSAPCASASSTASRAEGVDPYPRKFQRDHTIGEVRDQFPSLEAGEETEVVVRVAGRIMLMRGHGKLVFATIRDRSGSIQLFLSQSETGKDQLKEFETLFDIGDWVGVEGTVIDHQAGRAVGQGLDLRAALEGPAAAARQVGRAHRRRHALPPALRRPHRQRRRPPHLRHPHRGHQRHPQLLPRARLHRGRDARCCSTHPGRRHGHARSSPTTTRSTSTPTCASRSSCT